jgi:hypothetical protein
MVLICGTVSKGDVTPFSGSRGREGKEWVQIKIKKH